MVHQPWVISNVLNVPLMDPGTFGAVLISCHTVNVISIWPTVCVKSKDFLGKLEATFHLSILVHILGVFAVANLALMEHCPVDEVLISSSEVLFCGIVVKIQKPLPENIFCRWVYCSSLRTGPSTDIGLRVDS